MSATKDLTRDQTPPGMCTELIRCSAHASHDNACPNWPSRPVRGPTREGYDQPSHAREGVVEAVTHEDAHRFFDRMGLTRACDLDLLIFFARHPNALLASESLASFIGYDLKDIADSLEVLMVAGLLARVQTPAHAARFYVFAPDDTHGDWLPSLVALASTREGRLALRRGLRRGRRDADREGTPRNTPGSLVKQGPRRMAPAKTRTGTA